MFECDDVKCDVIVISGCVYSTLWTLYSVDMYFLCDRARTQRKCASPSAYRAEGCNCDGEGSLDWIIGLPACHNIDSVEFSSKL